MVSTGLFPSHAIASNSFRMASIVCAVFPGPSEDTGLGENFFGFRNVPDNFTPIPASSKEIEETLSSPGVQLITPLT